MKYSADTPERCEDLPSDFTWLRLGASSEKTGSKGCSSTFPSFEQRLCVAVSCFFVVGPYLPPFPRDLLVSRCFFSVFFVFVELPPLAALTYLSLPISWSSEFPVRGHARRIHRPASSPRLQSFS